MTGASGTASTPVLIDTTNGNYYQLVITNGSEELVQASSTGSAVSSLSMLDSSTGATYTVTSVSGALTITG